MTSASANIPPRSDANGAPTSNPSSRSASDHSASSLAATQELLRQTLEAKDSAMALISNVQSVVGIAQSAMREQMQARPYLTMGAAAGVGYVLAGGLASTLTRQLMKMGTKAATTYAAALLMQKVKEAAAQSATDESALG